MSRTCSGVTCSICCFASSIRSCPVLKVIETSGVVGCDGELSLSRIENGGSAERNRPLLVDVPDGNSRHAGDAELIGDLANDFVEGAAAAARILGAFDARAEHDRFAAVERARQHELLQHAVDAI